MKKCNLNEITRRYTDYFNHEPADKLQADFSTRVVGNFAVESIFKNLEGRVVEKIRSADAVVGCVAWLTNEKILRALSEVKKGVSLILQKEDFLRPDFRTEADYVMRLHRQYSQLKEIEGPNDAQLEKLAHDIGEASAEWIDLAVRCVGLAKDRSDVTLPRMHHKFLVFCRHVEDFDQFWNYVPYAIWTGSFNMTFNGTQSIENAVYIENEQIATSFFDEWFQMLMISEGLDWVSPYSEPDIQYNNLAALS